MSVGRFDWIKSVNARKPYPATTHQALIGRGIPTVGTGGSGGDKSMEGPINSSVESYVESGSESDKNTAVQQTRTAIEENGGDWGTFAKGALTSGCHAGLVAAGLDSALGWICDAIGPIWDWLVEACTLPIYPYDDFIRWAAEKAGVDAIPIPSAELVAETRRGATRVDPWSHVTQAMRAKGYYPIYCGRDETKRAALRTALNAMNWKTKGMWGRQYGDWYTPKNWCFGLLLDERDMTGDALALACAAWGTPADRAAMTTQKAKAKAVMDIAGTKNTTSMGLDYIDRQFWGVRGIFPKMPGSLPPTTIRAKCGIEGGDEAPPASKPTSTAAKVAIGVGVLGAAAAIGKWVLKLW